MPPLDTPPITGKPNELESYWLPFTANRAFKQRPRLISGAKDMHFFTPEGRKVLDATSGLYCVNAGHCREPIVKAIQEAAGRLDYSPAFQFATPQVFELSNQLALMAPGDLDYVLFANSGSEAVDTAMKVALSFHKINGQGARTRFIGRERGYHGVCFGGISVGGMVNNRKAFGNMLMGVDHLQTTYNRAKQAYTVGEPEWGAETADELLRLIGLHDASTIAAVIVEPVQGSTGCIPPPKGYLKRLREITEQHGILLIFDEVITGFGRIGGAFSAERFGIVPDMITFAKGVTNGSVPMSGIMVRKGIYDAHMTGPDYAVELFHGFTYSGHPLAVAAGLATLRVYRDEGLFERARAMEKPFADAMMSLKGLPHVADIRPIGMMCGIDLDSTPGKVGARGYDALERAFFDHDLYIRLATDTIVTAPPLIATESDIGQIRDKIAALLKSLP